MARFLSLFFLLLSVQNFSYAQSPFGSFGSPVKDSVLIYSPIPSTGNPRLDALIEGQVMLSRENPQSTIQGYRIRIVSFSGQTARQRTLDARARFSKEFPAIPAYWIYTEPDYKVYVGDYRSKTDAYRDLVAIQRSFSSAFIVTDQIALPSL